MAALKYISILYFLLITLVLHAQKKTLWRYVTNVPNAKGVTDRPEKVRLVETDFEQLKAYLLTAPKEDFSKPENYGLEIELPCPDGKMGLFRVVEYSIMKSKPASKYSEIKTYTGIGIDDPTTRVKMGLNMSGFYAFVTYLNNDAFCINPIIYGNINTYEVKQEKQLSKLQFSSSYNDLLQNNKNKSSYTDETESIYCNKIRVYKLALTCTGWASHDFYSRMTPKPVDIKQAVREKLLEEISKVNEIYERELGIRFEPIIDDALIFEDPQHNEFPPSDQDNNPPSIIEAIYFWEKGQSWINEIIGVNNYDIGLIISAHLGGITWGLAEPCGYLKAYCLAGMGGGEFYVTIAHELAHVLKADHTFNAIGTKGCSNANRDGSTAFEPGSGSTIMGYPGGDCDPYEVQGKYEYQSLGGQIAKPYFHGASIEQIQTFVNANNLTCGTWEPKIGSFLPTTISAEQVCKDCKIPLGTSFRLKSNNEIPGALYCWEQMDKEDDPTEPPFYHEKDGPIFRSYPPVSVPDRYFPNLRDQATPFNKRLPDYDKWEVLPYEERKLNFRLTIRDNHGCALYNTVEINVDGKSGPFKVTKPNSPFNGWSIGSEQTILWDVKNTNQPPVSCTKVDILLSIDGGLTYPITLKEDTPNDGNETITVPNNKTKTARIMVKARDNIFFDISDYNFFICPFTVEHTTEDATCNGVCDGKGIINAVGTSQPFHFFWREGINFKNDPSGTSIAKDLCVGEYILDVADDEGCIIYDTVKIEPKNNLILDVTIEKSNCYCWPCEVTVKEKAYGGFPPYTYTWYPCKDGDNSAACFTAEASVKLDAFVKDSKGCIARKPVNIDVVPIFCVAARDPNDLVGPAGLDSLRWVARKDTLPYTIRFENDAKIATAPAQRVYLEFPFDANADPSTFRVGRFGFAGKTFDVPPGRIKYQTRVDARDSTGVFVDVIAGVDIAGQKAYWIFQAVDPATGVPPTDPLLGLLPVNDSITNKGQGFVEFSIKARANTATGDTLGGQAEILFDTNDTIPTNTWRNVIDAVAPSSLMQASVSAEIDSTRIPLAWTAQDDPGGCGIGGYNLYVSQDGGPFTQEIGNWPETDLLYDAERGHTYRFFVQAVDRVGNAEPLKTQPETTVRVKNEPRLDFISVNSTGLCGGDELRMVWTSSEISAVDIAYSADGGASFIPVAANVPDSAHYFAFAVGDYAQDQTLLLRITDAATPARDEDTLSVVVHPRPTVVITPNATTICAGAPLSLTASGVEGTYYWSPYYSVDVPDSNVVQVTTSETTRFFVTGRDLNGCTAVDSADVTIYPRDSIFLSGPACTPAEVGIFTENLLNQYGCDSIVVLERIADTLPPIVITRDVVLALDASGHATLAPEAVDDGSLDDCPLATFSLDKTDFTCADIGAVTVILTVTDQSNNSASLPATVTILDTLPPTLLCEPITLALDATGAALLAPEDVLDADASTDNCALDLNSLIINTTNFDCGDIGVHTIVLSGADIHGNTASCSAEVTVLDNTPPAAHCQDKTVNLDAGGNAAIGITDIDAGSADACGVQMRELDITQFSCADLGVRAVTLTVTDVHGNTGVCTATVTVQDLLPPVTSPLPAISAACSATLVPPSALDNCSGTVTATTSSPLNYPAQGVYTVTWTFTDGSGNTATQTQQVVVDDNAPPTITCPADRTLLLDAACAAALPDYTAMAAATDNCSAMLTQSPAAGFAFSGPAAQTVSLTATDPGGNTAICSFTVAATDAVAPHITCAPAVSVDNDPGDCTAMVVVPAPAATDNCGTPSLNNDFNNTANASGAYPVGVTQVTWTAADASGNTATCQQTVSVADGEAPGLSCPGVQTVELDANCSANLPDYTGLAVAGDNCTAPAALVLAQLPAANTVLTGYGTLSVQFTATDAAGNTRQCAFTVHKNDHLAPTIACPANQVLPLGAGCSAALPDYSGDATASNNCAPPELTQTPAPGAILSGLGTTTLTLKATDVAGNTAACAFTVTRTDPDAPVILCPSDRTIALNAQCEAALPDYRNLAGVADNCPTTVAQAPAPGALLSGAGTLSVTVTATDVAGNTASCAFSLTKQDNNLPTITNCPAAREVPLNAACQLIIPDLTGELVATDNCTAPVNLSLIQGPAAGAVLSLSHGQTTDVVLNVTDEAGNTAACAVTLTARDQQAPSLSCPSNRTLALDHQCQALMPAYTGLALYSDNCTATNLIQLAQSPLAGTAVTGTGTSTVTFTALDAAGNTSACSFTVTRTDQTAPAAVCANYTLQLDANGAGAVTAANLDAGSSDACGPVGLSIQSGQTSFTCDDAGQAYPLVLLVTDANGNTATCSAAVTVADDVHPCCAAPVAICQNSTLALDATGEAILLTTQVDNGSTYDCGLDQMTLDISSFDCADIGTHTVTLTVTDQEGSSAQCTALITVADNTAPIPASANLPDVVAECSVTVAPPTAQDNCAGAVTGMTSDPVTYSSQGNYTIHWSYTDAHGNTSTQNQTVVVDDNIPLTLLCPGAQVQALNGSCQANLADYRDLSTATDNCGNITKVQTPAPGAAFAGAQAVAVTITATDAGGNQTACSFTVALEDQNAPASVCKNLTVQLNAAGTAAISGTQVDDGSADACGILSRDVSPGVFTCGNVGANDVVLTVTDVNGNTSTCSATVTVEDHVAPVAQCQPLTVQLNAAGNGTITAAAIDNGSSDACGLQNLVLSQTAFTCAHAGPNTVTLTATDVHGNTATCAATVTVEDHIAPEAHCKNAVVSLNSSGQASLAAAAVNDGSSDACGIQTLSINPSAFTCADLGQHTVVLTATDQNGNTATCSAVVSVEDHLTPSITCPQGIQTLPLGPACTAVVPDYSGALLTLSDNCSVNVSQVPAAGVLLQESGFTFVSMTVSDPAGNTAVCDILVQVADNTPPTAICRDLNVPLDASGQVVLTAAMVNNGSADACGLQSLTLSPLAFNCSQVGANTVTLTVKDANNNTASCQATVTVQDLIAPTAQCRNILVALNAAGQATVSAASVNNNSWDACGIASLAVNPAAFTCAQVGPNQVVLTVTDNHGNTGSCAAVVSVADQTAPQVTCQNKTVALDAAGTAGISAADIGVNLSDACGIAAINLSPNSFSCAGIGQNTVTLTATDQNGNSSTCTAAVTVQDNTPPVARCRDTALALDAAGAATLSAAAVDDGSTDACGIQSITLSPSVFQCANVGPNTVVLTVTDARGNTASCQATVVITDDRKPVALCRNVAIPLDMSGNGAVPVAAVDAGSADACGLAALSLSQTAFNCTQLGNNTVTLTVTDVNGNTGTCTATVVVQDITPPSAQCSPATVYLNPAGNATLPAVSVDNRSLDACGAVTLGVAPANLSCLHTGNTPVTLTVTDAQGNSSTCTAIVTVLDTVAPQAQCKAAAVQLGASGTGSIQPADVNNNSSDACGIAGFSLSKSAFSCADVGVQTVVLTVTDVHGNSRSCAAQVTVEGSSLPVPTAELTYIWLEDEDDDDGPDSDDDDCNHGWFTVHAGATNACGPASNSVAVIRVPKMLNPVIVYKVKNKKKLQFKINQNKVQVDAPNPQAWWAQITADGGVRVVDGQELKFDKKDNDNGTLNYDFRNDGALERVQGPEMVLAVKVSGAAAYTATALDWAEIPCDPEHCFEDDDDDDDVTFTDSDCDGVSNNCDQCFKGNDSIDNNQDSLPDCAFPPGYHHIIPAWKCGPDQVFVCHKLASGARQTLCIHYADLAAHRGHGDFLGPCNNSTCPPSAQPGIDTRFTPDQSSGPTSTPDLLLFPDPTSNDINIRLMGMAGRPGELRMFDPLGNMIWHQKVPDAREGDVLKVNMREMGFAAGVYLVVLHAEQFSRTKRFILGY